MHVELGEGERESYSMMTGRIGKKVEYEEDSEEMKKGPWKVEEDEVLIKHVRKYGPRDWSSIRSKGLLRRTGKSCRLRWVNKLRPDLKTGVKFSAEEERSVIDLQAQFGNKWAKIATYLPGRTDNDVKNFWSSRQKRLARILHVSAPSSSNHFKPPSLEAPKLSSSSTSLPISPYCDDKIVPFWDLMYPSSIIYDTLPLNSAPLPPLSFPQIPQFKPDFPLLIQSQHQLGGGGGGGGGDPSFIHHFDHTNASAQAPTVSSSFGSHQISTVEDSFMYDLPPIDIFDQIQPLPSPSQWL